VVEGPITQSDNEDGPKGPGMMGLIQELMRPYRGSLAMILVAMLVQSTMTLAAPWPLKIIIDPGSPACSSRCSPMAIARILPR
jgi:hypothetical protein